MRNHDGTWGGINEVAWDAKLLPTYVHLCPCYGLGPFWLLLSVTEQTAWLPVSYVPWTHLSPTTTLPPTPLYTTLVILQKFSKTSKTSYIFQLHCNATIYKTGVLMGQTWRGYNQASVNLNVSNWDILKCKM